MHTNKQKGNLTEIKTMASFMEHGWNVLLPYGGSERYDYVVDVDGVFYRIQCKTATAEDDGFYITCKSKSWDGKSVPYTEDEIDYFATYFGGKTYLIPVEIAGRSSFKLRLNPTKTGQKARINWAKNYDMEEIVRSWSKKE